MVTLSKQLLVLISIVSLPVYGTLPASVAKLAQDSSVHVSTKPVHDLILLNGTEPREGLQRAMTISALSALAQQAAPIVMSREMLENICFWQADPAIAAMIDAVQNEAKTARDPGVVEQKIKDMLKKSPEVSRRLYPNESGASDVLRALSFVALNDQIWSGHMQAGSDLVLLIPKDYMHAEAATATSTINDPVRVCGFNPDNLELIPSVEPAKCLALLQKKTTARPLNFAAGVKSMLLPAAQDLDASWHIYLSGHGSPEQTKTPLIERIAPTQGRNTFFQRLVQAAKKHIQGAKESAVSQSQAASASKNAESAVEEHLGYIAGMRSDEFADLMRFFNARPKGSVRVGNAVNAALLYYSTCFSGGQNQKTVSDMLAKIRADFVVAAEGVNEQTVMAHSSKMQYDSSQDACILSTAKFKNFFTTVRAVFNGSKPIYADPLKAILTPLKQKKITIQNQAFIRMPGVGVFQTLSVDQKVKLLTTATVRAHELEKRDIDAVGAQAVFVCPERVAVPIRLAGLGPNNLPPSIVSAPSSLSRSQTDGRIHIFENIQSTGTLGSLMDSLVRHNQSLSPVTFKINSLSLAAQDTSGLPVNKTGQLAHISNMVVQLRGKQLSSSTALEAALDVMFESNGLIYQGRMKIENFEYALPDVWWKFRVTQASSSDIKAFAERILPPTEFKQLGEHVSLEALSGALDKKVDRPPTGALMPIRSVDRLNGLLTRFEKAEVPTDLAAQESMRNMLEGINAASAALKKAGQLTNEKYAEVQARVAAITERLNRDAQPIVKSVLKKFAAQPKALASIGKSAVTLETGADQTVKARINAIEKRLNVNSKQAARPASVVKATAQDNVPAASAVGDLVPKGSASIVVEPLPVPESAAIVAQKKPLSFKQRAKRQVLHLNNQLKTVDSRLAENPTDSDQLQEKGRLLLLQSKGNVITRNLKRVGSAFKGAIAPQTRDAMLNDEIAQVDTLIATKTSPPIENTANIESHSNNFNFMSLIEPTPMVDRSNVERLSSIEGRADILSDSAKIEYTRSKSDIAALQAHKEYLSRKLQKRK